MNLSALLRCTAIAAGLAGGSIGCEFDPLGPACDRFLDCTDPLDGFLQRFECEDYLEESFRGGIATGWATSEDEAACRALFEDIGEDDSCGRYREVRATVDQHPCIERFLFDDDFFGVAR